MASKTETLTDDEQLWVEDEHTRAIYRADLFQTAYELLGYKDLTWPCHGPVMQALEASTKRKLIVLPRGCFKSSICSIAYPIWLLLRNPNERILLDSELYRNARTFVREIKAHLTSERVTKLFGQLQGEPWSEGEIQIKTRTANYKEASVTASGIGAEKTSQHFSYIVADDLSSPSNSGTKEGRVNVITHWRMLTSILEPTGTLVLVGTRYAADDAIGHVIHTELNDQVQGDGLLTPN